MPHIIGWGPPTILAPWGHFTCATSQLDRESSRCMPGCQTCQQGGWELSDTAAPPSIHSSPVHQLPGAASSSPPLPQPMSNSRIYWGNASSQNLKTELMSHKSVLFQHDWNQSKTEKSPRNIGHVSSAGFQRGNQRQGAATSSGSYEQPRGKKHNTVLLS